MLLVFKRIKDKKFNLSKKQDRVHGDPSNHQLAFEQEGERDGVQNDKVHEINDLFNENDNE